MRIAQDVVLIAAVVIAVLVVVGRVPVVRKAVGL